MPAALWKALIFKLNNVGAAALEASYGAFRIEGVSKTSVCINDDGELDSIANLCDFFVDLGVRR